MLAWVVAAVALAVGASLYAVSRAQAAGAASRELAQLRTELEGSRGRAAKRSDAERKRDEELAELRRRLEKTKKRANQMRDGERQESGRIQELEEKLRLAQADARGMHAELQRAEAEIERLRAEPRPAPRPAPPPAPVVKDPAPAPPPPDAAIVRRAELAEGRVHALEEQLVAARVDAERQRRKAAAQDRLYVVLRGELDAKKERLRTQQEELERLRALRLVLADDIAEPPGASLQNDTETPS